MRARLLAILALMPLVAILCGCANPHAHPTQAKQVGLAELGRETAHLERISYLGTDERFHYFKTNDGTYYKLPKEQWQSPDPDMMNYPIAGAESLPEPDEPSFELYVAVRGDQIVLAPLP